MLGVFWGGAFMAAKFALEDFGPLTLASLRIIIGAATLLPMAILWNGGLPSFTAPKGARIWLHCLGLGIFSNLIPFSLLNWGQLHVSSGFAGMTMATIPLMLLPLAHFFIPSERMTRRKMIGFGLGFIGVAILLGPNAMSAQSTDPLEPFARVVCIIAASSYACGILITRFAPKVAPLPYSAAGMMLGAVISLPVMLMIEGVPSWPSLFGLLGVLALGVLATGLAMALVVLVVNRAGVTFFTLVNYQVPIWAVIFGVIVFDEILPPQFIAALALILVGLAVSQWRK